MKKKCQRVFPRPVSLQVMTLLSSDMSTAAFNSIPGQGVVYSVVVRDPLLNTSASYVPAHTYACSFASAVDGCQTLGELPHGSDLFLLSDSIACNLAFVGLIHFSVSTVNDCYSSFGFFCNFQERYLRRSSSPSLAWQACSSASLGIDSSNVVSSLTLLYVISLLCYHDIYWH